MVSNNWRSDLAYAKITSQRKEDTLTIDAYYMFVSLTKSYWSSWIYCFLQVVKDASKIRKDASLNTFDQSAIPDESLYPYHRNCYHEYTRKQKLKKMVAHKQVAVERKKNGRESRTVGTCSKLLNAHSLLKEICVDEFPTPFSFHMWFSRQCNLQNFTAIPAATKNRSFL